MPNSRQFTRTIACCVALLLCVPPTWPLVLTPWTSHQGTIQSVLGRQADFDRIDLDYAGLHPHEARLLQQTNGTVIDSSIYQPMRFQFDTQAIETRRGLGFDDEIDYIISTVLPAVADNWSRHLYVVPNRFPITINDSACVGIFQGEQQGDLLNTTLYDVDLAIAVAAYDEVVFEDGSFLELCSDSTTLALALPCSLDQIDRPAIGFINFCLNRTEAADSGTLTDELQQEIGSWLNTTFRDDQVQNDVIDIATHEIGHVLGFTGDLYKYYRDEFGNPRTPRPFQESTVRCPNGENVTQIVPSQETVQLLPSTGGRLSYHIVTPRVVQVVRNFFNCQTLQGARLNDSPSDCISSHWHERLHYGELMGPVYASASQNVLSPLTLALMEDTGFYRVDYRGAPSPAYGLSAGCKFVSEECVVNDKIPKYGNSSFCATPISFTLSGQLDMESLNSSACDPSHQSWVTCDLYNSTFLPFTFNTTYNNVDYWSAPELFTPNDNADSCPILGIGLGRDCTVYDPSYDAYYSSEVTGAESRCVSTFVATSDRRRYNRPACFQIACNASTATASVDVKVGDRMFSCNWDGQVITVDDDEQPYSIVCPSRKAVCPELFSCPYACSGRGVCSFNATTPFCQCFDASDSPICLPSIDGSSFAPSPEPTPYPRQSPWTYSPSRFESESYSPTLPPEALSWSIPLYWDSKVTLAIKVLLSIAIANV